MDVKVTFNDESPACMNSEGMMTMAAEAARQAIDAVYEEYGVNRAEFTLTGRDLGASGVPLGEEQVLLSTHDLYCQYCGTKTYACNSNGGICEAHNKQNGDV